MIQMDLSNVHAKPPSHLHTPHNTPQVLATRAVPRDSRAHTHNLLAMFSSDRFPSNAICLFHKPLLLTIPVRSCGWFSSQTALNFRAVLFDEFWNCFRRGLVFILNGIPSAFIYQRLRIVIHLLTRENPHHAPLDMQRSNVPVIF